MKLTDIVYKTYEEVEKMPRFDFNLRPTPMKWYLKPVAWLLSFPDTWANHTRIIRKDMDDVKGAYLLLCNHNSFFDFKVATKALFPRSANNVVAIDGFIGREALLRNVGSIGKRKFISDLNVVMNIKHSLFKNHAICALYPEARYSLVGTNSILPESLGKMVKLLKVQVATLICHGNHLHQPVWNLTKRKVNTTANLARLFTQEEVETLSIDEINQRIKSAFVYDDYRFQMDNNIKIDYKDRAKGLHKVLYQCPSCKVEHKMKSDGNRIWCDHCGKAYEMDLLGRLKATKGKTEFGHIPDWFEWQRKNVRDEIESGTYRSELEVDIDSLPNAVGYYRLGKGTFIHDMDGLHLKAAEPNSKLVIDKAPSENYGIHIEFDYFGRGDGVSFSMVNDTYYLYPTNQNFAVTKLHFAVEELYKFKCQNKPLK